MSLLLEYIENNPKETKLVGDYEKLQQLFTQAEALHYENKQKLRLLNLNSKGAGCKPKLSLGANNFSLFIPASYLSIPGCSIWS